MDDSTGLADLMRRDRITKGPNTLLIHVGHGLPKQPLEFDSFFSPSLHKVGLRLLPTTLLSSALGAAKPPFQNEKRLAYLVRKIDLLFIAKWISGFILEECSCM